jgi:hypothetical protein
MGFCRRVTNSLRNKSIKKCIPYLLRKILFLASKLYCPPRAHGKKLFVNFEHYDLANNEE